LLVTSSEPDNNVILLQVASFGLQVMFFTLYIPVILPDEYRASLPVFTATFRLTF
jgi:hypothetical protein